jgi:hypothetical protein
MKQNAQEKERIENVLLKEYVILALKEDPAQSIMIEEENGVVVGMEQMLPMMIGHMDIEQEQIVALGVNQII